MGYYEQIADDIDDDLIGAEQVSRVCLHMKSKIDRLLKQGAWSDPEVHSSTWSHGVQTGLKDAMRILSGDL